MSGFAPALKRPQLTTGASPVLLQRKCAACDKENRLLQRRPLPPRGEGLRDAGQAPPIVHEVLNSSGAPLGEAERAAFEPRFHHDFSAVRVHTDARAAASARAVNAEAYTVGHSIVFGAGASSGAAGNGLLAHELAHVVQQSGSGGFTGGPLTVSAAQSSAEVEANAVARAVMADRPARPSVHASQGLLRQELPKSTEPLAPPLGMGDLRVAEQLGTDQAVEEERRSKETGPVNLSGRPLLQVDIDNALKAVKGAASPTRISPAISGARFVLHDTGVDRAKKDDEARLREHVGFGRRSTGEGAAAWIMPDGAASISHDPLFGPRRPTATKWERGEDQMGEDVIWSKCRAVWNATKKEKREQALADVVSTQGSVGKEAKDELALAHKELAATAGKVHTAATWAVEQICDGVSDATVAGIAAKPESEPVLTSTCLALNDLFITRNARIARTMNVEIVKPTGSQYKTKDDDTGKREKFPPYSREVYDSVRDIYVKAALQARVFPEITTHREVDEKISSGHGDPRCFNLTCLYEDIAAAFGHVAGTGYGIAANAGTYGTLNTSDIWWDTWVCDAPVPAAGSCPTPTPPQPAAQDSLPKKAPANKTPAKKPK